MIVGVMNLSHWNMSRNSNMATPVAGAYAAALNLPKKMTAFLFSSDFGRGGSVKTVPLE